MNRQHTLHTRFYSFTIAACMDGMLGFVILAVPLFAIRLGADPWMLGMLGWVAQSVRIPFTLYSGRISDKVGRTRVIYPAAVIGVLGCAGLAFSHNFVQVLVCYTAVIVSMGGFYPALMAFIGDHSPQGELRKNLSFFNAGWATSCSFAGLMVGVTLPLGVQIPFVVSALFVSLAILLVCLWSRLPVSVASTATPDAEVQPAPRSPGPFLFIARLGLGLTVFGFAIITGLFPKLGKALAMSDSKISVIVGMLLAGQAIGILAAGASPWWRGKLWPQMLAQSMCLAASLAILLTKSDMVFGTAFFVLGTAVGLTYTGALYYGLQARTDMGKNTGIHESVIAVAALIGGLAGGATAQLFTLRTPYLVCAIASGVVMVVSLGYWGLKRK